MGDEIFQNLKVNNRFVLPYITSLAPPPALVATQGGGLAFDYITKRVYYCDGFIWIPLDAGGGTSTTSFFQYTSANSRAIPDNTITVLGTLSQTPTNIPPSPIPGFNLGTGVYTATVPVAVDIDCTVSWLGSNIGRRDIFINKFTSIGAINSVILRTTIEPSSSIIINGTQSAKTIVFLSAGDQLWVSVQQNSGSPVTILGDPFFSISGGVTPI
jgi:hypothetical protein